jgi:geranylgeranyl diphosphate synthase type I
MDGAEHRRGVPTTHAKHGLEIALLVGDLALVLADDMFLRAGFDSDATARSFIPYSSMRQHVIAGQYLDIAARERIIDEQMARRIAVLKSGRYTVVDPLVIGATLAAASDVVIIDLDSYGEPLGEAFQLRDDLLGTFGSGDELGKPTDSDIREGKRHFLYARAVAELGAEDRARFEELWGGGERLSASDVDQLRTLIERSGARDAAEKLTEELEQRALEELERAPIDQESRRALEQLTRLAVRRSA